MPRVGWSSVSLLLTSLIAVLLSLAIYSNYQSENPSSMLQRLNQINRILKPSTFQARNMSAINSLPSSWHSGPDDAFHGKITEDGPFKPEKDRYHLYIGLFCPFAHRANLVLHLKQLDKYAGIETSIVKPYPKGDDKVSSSVEIIQNSAHLYRVGLDGNSTSRVTMPGTKALQKTSSSGASTCTRSISKPTKTTKVDTRSLYSGTRSSTRLSTMNRWSCYEICRQLSTVYFQRSWLISPCTRKT